MTTTALLIGSGLVAAPPQDQDGSSGFGTLLQLARLNHFRRADLFAAFQIRFQRREDLSRLLTFSDARMASLARVARVSATEWTVDGWQPFHGSDPWQQLPWQLRGCATCFRHGYHSTLFQMPWIRRCPWHKQVLITHCRACERPLLEGFSQDLALLECVCGQDPIREVAILKGDGTHRSERGEFLEGYRAWVRQSKPCMLLLAPHEQDGAGRDALAQLIAPPDRLLRWRSSFSAAIDPRVHLDRVRRSTSTMPGPLYQEMVRCAHTLWPGEAGMAELPRSYLPPMLGVLKSIAAPLPPSELTERERRSLFLPPLPAEAGPASSRTDVLFLPVQETKNGIFLDTRVLHRTAYRVVSDLAWQWLNTPRRANAATSAHGVLVAAMRRVLARGYADGLKHVLGRYVPALFDHPRIKAGPRLPWVMVHSDGIGAFQALVAWSQRRPWSEDADVSRSSRTARASARARGATT